MEQTRILEIVTFRPGRDVDPDDFEAAAAEIGPWLSTQPGFIGRTLARECDGGFVDCIEWRSMDHAKRAASRLMGEPSAEPMMAMIDAATVSMRHYAIRATQ